MIGQLPKYLNVRGEDWEIRSDYRIALHIFQAFSEPDFSSYDKHVIMLTCLYKDFNRMVDADYTEAAEKAIWFLDGGKQYENTAQRRKTLDWEQDEQIIFPAVNKVAGKEIRELEYLHWWTFLGFFNEIGEGLFTNVLSIRIKKSKGKKLEKYEQEFYKENKDLIDIKQKYTAEEKAERDYLNNLLD